MNTELLTKTLTAATSVQAASQTLPTLNLSYWAMQTVAMAITCALIPKLRITSILGALGTVLALAFINATVWNTALFFQVPNTFTTQAGLLFLANGMIFWILVKVLPGIEVKGFFPALIAPVVFTVCSIIIDAYDEQIPWKKLYEMSIIGIKAGRDFFEHAAQGAQVSGSLQR